MNTNTTKLVKNSFIFIALALLGYGTFSFFNPSKTENPELELEKNLVLNELKDMSNAYEIAIKKSKTKDVKLEEAKQKIVVLIDSIKNTKSSIKELIILKTKQLELNGEMNNLIRENKELKQDNKILVHSLNKRINQLAKTEDLTASLKKEKDSLAIEKEDLTTVINKARYLNLLNLNIEGIKQRASGKEITTTKAKRVNKLKICYAIAKNTLVKEGDKTMHVQVLDPNNKVIALNNETLNSENGTIKYTFNTTFSYKNENLKVCDYLNFEEDRALEKGTYLINIYDGETLVTTSQIILK